MHLPFRSQQGHLRMGLKPLAVENWIDIDDDFVVQLALKAKLLSCCHQRVFAATAETQPAQQESLQCLISHLLTYFPSVYRSIEGSNPAIHNLKTQQTWPLANDLAPLDLAARLVQEDLCLMLPGDRGYELAAASVCFPLRWSLLEKIGQPIGQIHRRVPGYPQRLNRSVNNMFERLREDSPGLRFNWTIVDSPDLYLKQNKQITQHNPTITPENAGFSLWLRVERQTLRRLPVSGGVLFTIRTYVYPLAQVAHKPGVAADLALAIEALTPEMQIYKNLLPFKRSLMDYLNSHGEQQTPKAYAPKATISKASTIKAAY